MLLIECLFILLVCANKVDAVCFIALTATRPQRGVFFSSILMTASALIMDFTWAIDFILFFMFFHLISILFRFIKLLLIHL